MKKKLAYLSLFAQVAVLYFCFIFIFAFPTLKRWRIQSEVAAAAPIVQAQPENIEEPVLEGDPTQLQIPSLGLNIPVKQGEFTAKSWTLTTNNAHFATMTQLPNDKEGNSLFYGHNTDKVFKKTAKLEKGDVLYVDTSNGYRFIYEYVSDETVKPSNLSVFEYEGAPRVTLLTCKGVFNSTRRLMYFNLVKVVKHE